MKKKLAAWYLERAKDDDVIISASPEFLLSELLKRHGNTNLIASKVNPETGDFEGKN